MTPLHIVVPGVPVALKRHRHVTKGAFSRTYDPSKGDKEDFLWKCSNAVPIKPLEGPIMLEIVFGMPRPKSHYNKKGLKPDAPVFHTSKPDSTNLGKLVEDALNGHFWKDDSQICKLFVTKIYKSEPSTEIFISQINL